jgi:hypothetical protein
LIGGITVDINTIVLHLRAGFACGREKTCGTKDSYKTERAAKRLAYALSAKYEKQLQHYPCIFCGQWHIGNKIDFDRLEQLASLIE